LIGLYCSSSAQGQPATVTTNSPARLNNLTVVYDINVNSNKSNIGIEETYNGGIKTVMIRHEKARIRLVSLMRIQSTYFAKQDSNLAKVSIIKESGKKKYKYRLSAVDWKNYNTRYDSISYTLFDDSITVAGYNCKKALISIPGSGKEVTAYYSTSLKPLDKYLEPLFAGLPGMVLKYEQEDPKGTISFTANKVSFDEFDEKLLQEPSKGYILRNYTPVE